MITEPTAIDEGMILDYSTGQPSKANAKEPLFAEVKQRYSKIFRGNEEITLSDRALAFMVSELAKYDFGAPMSRPRARPI